MLNQKRPVSIYFDNQQKNPIAIEEYKDDHSVEDFKSEFSGKEVWSLKLKNLEMKDVLEFDLAGIEAEVYSKHSNSGNFSKYTSYVEDLNQKLEDTELDINFSK